MRYSLLFVVLFSGLLCSANRCERGQTVAPSQSFVLAPGENAVCKDCGIALVFVSVTEDSRCPTFTNCVWEGQAKLQVQLSGASTDMVELILRGNKPTPARVAVGGYNLVLLQLDPYPEAEKPTTPDDYRATFVLEPLQ